MLSRHEPASLPQPASSSGGARSRRAGFLSAALLFAALPACHVAKAKIYNLSQLHDADSHHRYTAALEGDMEYVFRHQLLGLFRSIDKNVGDKDGSRVDAPADECLANLIALEAIESDDPAVSGEEVGWFARLAVEDPWQLSRQRAVLALADRGEQLKAGLPAGLGKDQTPADPDLVANTLTPLVKALHDVLDARAGEREGARKKLEEACTAARALDYDMSGARRALALVVALQSTAGTRNADTVPLAELSFDLQRLCVRRALARAIDDPAPIVRAAALSSTARIGGRVAIDTVLFDRMRRLLKDPKAEPEELIGIVDTLAASGPLPESAAAGGHTREEWLATLFALVNVGFDENVRVHAMMALSRLSDSGFASLHEEDWQDWWIARTGGARGGSGAAR